jgi:hypothetical protein
LVCAFQGISGKKMIKAVFAVLPVNQIKVLALVFDMAVFTLLKFFVGMRAFTGRNACSKQRVTAKAFLSRQLLSAFMTLRTISHALKMCMGVMQFPGRKLREQD